MKSGKIIAQISFALSLVSPLFLTGCLFGENKQFFEGPTASMDAITGPGLEGVTPTPSPAPTATPTPSGTPTDGQSPIAVNDGPFETAKNLPIHIAIADLLLNDSDPNLLPLRLDSYQAPSSGSLSQSGGDLIFTPSLNFVGSVTFVYQIANSHNLTATATVTINVRVPATEAIYAQSSSRLYAYDTVNHSANFIANFRYSNGSAASVFDIAITPAGLMYGVDGRSLYYVNPTTSILSQISTPGLTQFGNVNGLTSLSDGRLVIAGNGVAIYTIATHELVTLVAPNQYQTSGDIIALPDGYLYWSVNSGAGNQLLKINPSNGQVTLVGTLSYFGVWGLGFANNILYGFDSTGAVFEINPANAQTTHQVSTGISWYGATTNPVLW